MKVDPDEILHRLDELDAERYQWTDLWQDVVDYMLPNRSPVIGTITPGEDRSVEMYDSTAYKSLLRLAANLNDMLTNQSSQWFQLGVDDPDMQDDPIVQEWLMQTTEAIRNELDNSNFYDQVHELYLDLGSFGTGIMYIEPSDDDEDSMLNFKTCHIREIYVAENKYGRIDTLFRLFEYSARQCVQRWGIENVSDNVMDKYNDKPDELFEIMHIVFPREERDPKKKDNKNMKYASIWMEKEAKHILSESGYDSFPYLVPRWMKSSGETYGRSPAISVLADIKTLNTMMETTLIAGQMIAEPPLMVPDDGFMNINIEPRGISYYRAGSNDFIRPIDTGSNRLPITFEMIQAKRDSVADAFFATQLQMIDKTEMTAEEVRARMQENMRVIGPTIGRLQNELLQNLIFRIISILNNTKRDGKPVLPLPPEEVQGLNYKLKYVSPLAKAKRYNELQAIQGSVNMAGQWAEIRPEIMDNLDMDSAYRKSVDIMGAPVDILNTEDEVMATRQQRQQQQQAVMQAQMQQAQAETAEKGSKAAKNVADIEGRE